MMKELSAKTKIVNWTGDVRAPTPQWYIDVGRHIHLTLFTNMYDVEICRRHGIKSDYLQIGVPDKIFTPNGLKAFDVPEIVFFGNNPGGFPLSKMRQDMVRSLKQRYGSRFGVYGSGWGSGTMSITDQHAEASMYRAAKIAINLSHFDYPRYTSDRMLRAMGSGRMVLSHNYQGIGREFVIGKHLETWDNFSELFSKIDAFIENDLIRAEMAELGSLHVHANHTWRNRIEDLMKMI
jgi:spore maturation protein CgeB